MDAVVLAGGYATRMWPITKRRPKCSFLLMTPLLLIESLRSSRRMIELRMFTFLRTHVLRTSFSLI
ncbi:hypothetical protein D8S78_20665 [Natrialba swarupiae]|nr:hypothetical protein [Natrialba swarupiae]